MKEKKKVLWLEVIDNLKSFIFKDEEEVMKAIQLSYDHLSDHLKLCILYLACYPKERDIEISELKDLRSAEGLVEPTDLKSVKEVMEVYVNELISSSLVIVRGGRKQRCQIPDLVHDFCSIKARNEKLFDLTSSIVPSSSSSSSSSDPMLHRMAIYWDQMPFLFNPEKKNPSAKHLSLELYDYHPYNCHLRHLRLLKKLEIRNTILTNSLLNEIGMLLHLRCLIIRMEEEALPLSFSNLWNLEILEVDILDGSNLVLSPSIWSLAKLRHVDIFTCAVFDSDIHKPTKLENLTTLKFLKISCSVDSKDIFKRFPNLRTLGFCMDSSAAEQIYSPRLDALNKLEKVYAEFKCSGRTHVHQFDFHFPSSLKEVELEGFDLTSDSLSRIGRSLPNLRKLTLSRVSFSEWQVIADESFPVLEELNLVCCYELKEIPESFGEIASLKFISVQGSPQLKESVFKIKEYIAEMMGEDKLEVQTSFN